MIERILVSDCWFGENKIKFIRAENYVAKIGGVLFLYSKEPGFMKPFIKPGSLEPENVRYVEFYSGIFGSFNYQMNG